MQEILLVIPSYNEEKNIQTVVGELERDFPELDYIVVNDGSRDRTAQICREKGFHLLDLPVNLGLAGAFQTGMNTRTKKGMPMRFSLTRTGSTFRNIWTLCLNASGRDMIL